MIEDFTRTAITTLLAQGTGWVVAVLLGIYAWILDKRNVNCQTVAEQAVKDQYEKRLDEFREILDVMTNSTHATVAMQGSVVATTDAINQLAQGFAKLLTEFEGQQARWDDRGGQMAKQLEDVRNRLETLQRRGRAA